MRSSDRPDTSEGYDESHAEPYEDDDRSLWFPYDPRAWWPWSYGASADEGYRGQTYDEDISNQTDDDDTWLDEGAIGLLLIAGVALFVFPEPATSGLGIALIVFAVVLWILDWAV